MQKNEVWLPLIASVGVGAATFYTMTKNNQGMGQTMQQMVPFISNMGGSNSGGNSGGNTGNNTGNSGNNNSGGNSQKLGPFGMS